MRALAWLPLILGALVILPWDAGVLPGPMHWNQTHTAADEPVDAAAYTRQVLMFPCGKDKCQAWFYLPKHTDGKPPVIVAAHGIGCQKDFSLDKYGSRFAMMGFATFIFDYRTFGGSEGLPRHWVSPRRHLQDYMSAVAYVKAELSGVVDVNRLNLWGTSFSGGHVLTLAGTQLRDNVTAVIAQVPHTDGLRFLVHNLKRRPLVVLRGTVAGVHDAIRSLFNYPPAYIPLTGERRSFSVLDLPPEEATLFYRQHPQPRQGGWRNMVRAMVVLEGLLYRPVRHVPNIRAPVLYLAARNDSLFELEDIQAALNVTPDGQLFTAKGGHFSVYSGLQFPFFMQHMVAFLQEKNGMKRTIMSSAEAHGIPRARPTAEHKSADPGITDEIAEERSEITETLSEL